MLASMKDYWSTIDTIHVVGAVWARKLTYSSLRDVSELNASEIPTKPQEGPDSCREKRPAASSRSAPEPGVQKVFGHSDSLEY